MKARGHARAQLLKARENYEVAHTGRDADLAALSTAESAYAIEEIEREEKELHERLSAEYKTAKLNMEAKQTTHDLVSKRLNEIDSEQAS